MNKRGQSIIEYTLIAILVILGIVYMGPYVLRSVNGYFKLWDSGVQDSFEEGLQQAPVNDIPDFPFPCKCDPPIPGACGVSGCAPGYRASTQICTPLGCNGAQTTTCTFDPACCDLQPATCGTVPLTSPLPSPLNNCYYGQELKTSECDPGIGSPVCSPTVTTNCIPAPECVDGASYGCLPPACQGSYPSPGGQLCPGADTGLAQPFSYTYVSTCPLIPPATPQCQYTCKAGFAQNEYCTIEYHVAAAVDCNNCGAYCCTNNRSKTWCADASTVYTAACSQTSNDIACIPGTSGCCTPGPPAVNSDRCGYKDSDQCDPSITKCHTGCSLTPPSSTSPCPAGCSKADCGVLCCPPYAVPKTLCYVNFTTS